MNEVFNARPQFQSTLGADFSSADWLYNQDGLTYNASNLTYNGIINTTDAGPSFSAIDSVVPLFNTIQDAQP